MRYAVAVLAVASIVASPVAAQAATPSQAAIKSALKRDVKRALAGVAKLDLAKVQTKGFKLKRVRALVAGKVSVSARANGMTVVRGSLTFSGLSRSRNRSNVKN